MVKKRILFLLVFISLVMLLVAGCGSPDTGPVGEGEEQVEQVAAQNWRMQTAWAPSITLWRGDKYFVDLMNVLAEGELSIEYFEGGTLYTSVNEGFDAISVGTIQMTTDWPSYWEGKDTAFALITSTPLMFNPADYLVWFWQGGGFELAQELYAPYNIVWFPHSVTGPESGQRSNVPIYTADDYKDVKMRQCGRLQSTILEDMGGSPIFMPGSELYLALQLGTIDAAEFSVPECDYSMGLHEVTKYWVLPGWHQPGPVSGIMVNKDAYDKLQEKTKFKFKEAAMATMLWAWTYFEYSSIEYTQRILDSGVEVTRLDDETLERIQALTWDLLLQDAADNPNFAKIFYSQVRFLKNFSTWREMQSPFMWGRTPPDLDRVYDEAEALAKQHGVYDAVIALEVEVRERMEGQKFWTPGTPYEMNPVKP